MEGRKAGKIKDGHLAFVCSYGELRAAVRLVMFYNVLHALPAEVSMHTTLPLAQRPGRVHQQVAWLLVVLTRTHQLCTTSVKYQVPRQPHMPPSELLHELGDTPCHLMLRL
jgi:hypothetical protein